MTRPNHLGTFRSDMRQARHWVRVDSRDAKTAEHRRFRRLTRLALRRGIDPPPKIGCGWYY